MDTNELGNMMAQVIAGGNATAKGISGYISQQVALTKDLQDAILAKGNADVIMQQAKETGEMQAQQAALKVGTALGTNLADTGEQMTRLAQDRITGYSNVTAARDRIHQKESVQFLDDPLQFFMNQLTLPADREALKFEEDKLNMAGTQQDNLIATSNASAIQQRSMAQTITQASIAANSESIAQNASINALATKNQSLAFGVQGIEAIQRLKEGNLSAAMQFERFKVELKDRELRDLDDQKAYTIYAAGVRYFNGEPMDFNSFGFMRRERLLDPNNPAVRDIMQAGFAQLNGKGWQGTSPLSTLSMYQVNKSMPVQEEQQRVLGNIQNAWTEFTNKVRAGTYTPEGAKTPVQIDLNKPEGIAEAKALFDKDFKSTYTSYFKNIDGTGGSNPYNIKGLYAFDLSPQVQQTETWNKVLKNLSRDTPMDQVAQTVASAVINGTVKAADAAATLAAGYKAELVALQASSDFGKYGLQDIDVDNYTVRVSNGSGFLGRGVRPVVAVDPNSWTAFIAEVQGNRIARDPKKWIDPYVLPKGN